MTLTREGRPVPFLHELKDITSSREWYKVILDIRGVDRRAELLHGEYVDKAREVDFKICGATPGEQGRVERMLQSYPKVLSSGPGERPASQLTPW